MTKIRKLSGTGPRKRGDAAEYRLRDRLVAAGIPARRVVISGGHKDHPGDVEILQGHRLLQSKYLISGWRGLRKKLGDYWALVLQEPGRESLVVMEEHVWMEVLKVYLTQEDKLNGRE